MGANKMIYKVGDTVTLRKDFKEGSYGHIYFVREMLEFRGRSFKITDVIKKSEGTHYTINDGAYWDYSSEMFVSSWKEKYGS